MIEESTTYQQRDKQSKRTFVTPKKSLGISAAAIGITAVIGTTAVLGADALTNSRLPLNPTPVAEIAPTSPGQQSLPSFATLVDHVKPAVVSVYVTSEQKGGVDLLDQQGGDELQQGSPFQFFFRQFGEGQSGDQTRPQITRAQGSGFFISADGYVLTNNHVVDHAKTVEVMTTDGKRYSAKVAGVDPRTDLALLKVKGSTDFPYVKFAEASPRIGDWVLAVGNPFGLGGTATAGIVSAKDRDIGSGLYDDYMQIDAPINKGNSGGPTFNLRGEVVGVNTAIFSPSGGSVGIAFDIPAETAKFVSDQLEKSGHVERGWIGVSIQPVTPDIADSLGLKEAKGALVDEPQQDSPASQAGIRSQDVIVSVDGKAIEDARGLARTIAAMPPGQSIKVALIRNGEQRTVELKVGSYPSQKTAEASQPGDSSSKLGLTLAPAEDVAGAGSRGAVVVNVDPNGAAAEKGVQQGDVILQVGGKSVAKPSDVRNALKAAKKDNKRAVLMQLKTAQGERFVAIPTGES
jgi:serine protease Do